MAERQGFEPWLPGSPVKRFSRPPHSTALPPLREVHDNRKWRRDGDLNPGYAFGVYTISNRAPSASSDIPPNRFVAAMQQPRSIQHTEKMASQQCACAHGIFIAHPRKSQAKKRCARGRIVLSVQIVFSGRFRMRRFRHSCHHLPQQHSSCYEARHRVRWCLLRHTRSSFRYRTQRFPQHLHTW